MQSLFGRKKRALLFAALLSCCVMMESAVATTYYVSTTGNDSNPGTSGSPFKTIQKGINSTSAGDTVEVAAGTYRQRLTITSANSGTPGAPITIHGAEGAIIDASEDLSLTWYAQSGYNGGVYTAQLPFRTNAVFAGENAIMEMDWASASAWNQYWNPWYYTRVLTYGLKNVSGLPDYDFYGALPKGWDGVRGLALCRTTDNVLFVKLMPDGDGSTPLNVSQQTMRISPYKSVAVTIDGANDIILDGFAIKYAYTGIFTYRCKGVEIKNCTIKPCFNGIKVLDDTDGISIHNNEIAVDYMCSMSTKNEAENIWHMNKTHLVNTDHEDKHAIKIKKSKGNHRIYDNWIHDGGVGISSGDHLGPEESILYDQNTEVNHNLIERTYQDAFGPGYNVSNHKWHHNIVSNCLQFGRLFAVMYGPLYMYNNIHIAGPITMNNLIMYGDSEGQAPDIYIYNNTWTTPLDSPINQDPGYVRGNFYHVNNAPENGAAQVNHHIYNNLFYGDRWLKTYSSGEDFDWDGNFNVYAQRSGWLDNITGDGGTNPAGGEAYALNQGIDLDSLWTTSSPGFANFGNDDLSLVSSSPARGAGANLYSLFGSDLPGDVSTDCGALAYGESMLDVPGTTGGALSKPRITTISPDTGSTSGGTTVTLTGTSLTGASVSFGGSAASSIAVSPSGTHLTCVSPARSAGVVDVTVTTAYGTSNALTYTYGGSGSVPGLSSISPNSGTTAGGTSCTLTGSNFISGATVSFGGTAATNVVVVSSTSITCTSPAKSAGAVNVTVTTSGGTSGAQTYTYTAPGATPTLSAISPNSGTTAGGTSCTLTGTNFISGATVSFGGTAATNVTVVSSTSITCTSPAKSAGAVNVTVTTSGGTSGAQTFTYSTGSTATLGPIADSRLSGINRSSNFGTQNNYQVQNNNASSIKGILKFDLSGLSGSTVTNAVLRVYKGSGTGNLTVTASKCSDDSWTETGITWNNAPSQGSAAATAAVTSTNGWYEWNITSYVNDEFAGDDVVSIFMTDEQAGNNKWTQWWTREYGTSSLRPELVVTTN